MEKQPLYYSMIKDHKRYKKILNPPLLTDEDKTRFISWVNEILPEMLWFALLNSQIPRDLVFQAFSTVCNYTREMKEAGKINKEWDCTLTGLAILDETDFDAIIGNILSFPNTIIALRPILLFEELPGYHRWKKLLNIDPNRDEDWEKIQYAIEKNFYYQSLQATDCCLVRFIFFAAAGRINISEKCEEVMQDITCAVNDIVRDPSHYSLEIMGTIRALTLDLLRKLQFV